MTNKIWIWCERCQWPSHPVLKNGKIDADILPCGDAAITLDCGHVGVYTDEELRDTASVNRSLGQVCPA